MLRFASAPPPGNDFASGASTGQERKFELSRNEIEMGKGTFRPFRQLRKSNRKGKCVPEHFGMLQGGSRGERCAAGKPKNRAIVTSAR
jgi:hypothetical protein